LDALAVPSAESDELHAALSKAFLSLRDIQADEDEIAVVVPMPSDEMSSYVNEEDAKYAVVKAGREFIVKNNEDEDDVVKFPTLNEALLYYQRNIAHSKDLGLTAKKIYEDFFCAFCLSDPAIDLCAFCGCRKCFGKFTIAEETVNCKDCGMDYHHFCCVQVNGTTWYCSLCKEKYDEREAKKRSAAVVAVSPVPVVSVSPPPQQLSAEAIVVDEVVDLVPVEASTGRKKKVGRPKGSLNKATELKLRSAPSSENEGKVASVTNALEIVGASMPLSKFSADEVNLLDQVRLWGLKYDLESVLDALELRQAQLRDL
jgi:hypothetical protein